MATAEISGHLYLAVDPSPENPQQRQTGDQAAVPPDAGRELQVIKGELGEARFNGGRFNDAARLMEQITTSDGQIDFLTLPGYRLLA